MALSDVAPSAVVGADVVAIPVLAAQDGGEPTLGPGAAELLDELDDDLFTLLETYGATGAPGEIVERAVLDTAKLSNEDLTLVLLVGVGAGTPTELRRAAAALARRTRDRGTLATSLATLADDAGLRAVVEGLVLGSYEFHWRSEGPVRHPVAQVVLTGLADVEARRTALERALAIAGAGWMSRTLALVPSNVKNPVWLAERAQQVAESSGLKIKVWDEEALAADGFGGILGVGAGSDNPPRLVRLDYTPKHAGRKTPHVAIIGKGITFDTGGLSLKTALGMTPMKRDMTGAGVVLSVLGALAAIDCPVRVTGLMCCAENSVGARSMRPGDVLRHYGGRTTEVNNTDAEGRLVLGDGIAYAVDAVRPDLLVDVATLTGAVRIALGRKTGGFFSTDDALADTVRGASLAAGEPVWRLPLVDDYEDKLDSRIADSDNDPGRPGAITAALFLRRFTAGLPWLHFDIAGVGDSEEDEFEYTKGATGFGARLLLHWLEMRDPLQGLQAPARKTGA
ncbi:MAG TPA: leucyl aminopeptidase family protein [Nocardioidaceae bacterium]|nr:leucyl aminopeptidase family protein [Nocardioidaceae bacterium]